MADKLPAPGKNDRPASPLRGALAGLGLGAAAQYALSHGFLLIGLAGYGAATWLFVSRLGPYLGQEAHKEAQDLDGELIWDAIGGQFGRFAAIKQNWRQLTISDILSGHYGPPIEQEDLQRTPPEAVTLKAGSSTPATLLQPEASRRTSPPVTAGKQARRRAVPDGRSEENLLASPLWETLAALAIGAAAQFALSQDFLLLGLAGYGVAIWLFVSRLRPHLGQDLVEEVQDLDGKMVLEEFGGKFGRWAALKQNWRRLTIAEILSGSLTPQEDEDVFQHSLREDESF